jgi:hypothetical protein
LPDKSCVLGPRVDRDHRPFLEAGRAATFERVEILIAVGVVLIATGIAVLALVPPREVGFA